MQQNQKRVLLRKYQILGCKRRGIAPIIPISTSKWNEMVKNRKAPKPIYLGPRTVAWWSDEIELFCEGLENKCPNYV